MHNSSTMSKDRADLGQGCEAVSGAGGVRHNGVLLGIIVLLVDTHHKPAAGPIAINEPTERGLSAALSVQLGMQQPGCFDAPRAHMGASLLGAEMTTLLAPALMCASACSDIQAACSRKNPLHPQGLTRYIKSHCAQICEDACALADNVDAVVAPGDLGSLPAEKV